MRRRAGLKILFLCLVACGAGCTQRHVRNWHELDVGMDQRTVRHLLGSPTARMGPVTAAEVRPEELLIWTLFLGELFDREGWVYNRRGLFAGLDNLFGPSPDAHVVYFDDTGHVLGWREPLTKGDPRPGAPARAFWRRYLQLVAATDGAAELVEDIERALTPMDFAPPVPRRGTCDARATCLFEWDPPPHHTADMHYWLQIGLGEGESPTTAPVHELPRLTFATPRTTLRLEFGLRLTEQPLAFWRVRAVDGAAATDWSPWQRIELIQAPSVRPR